jgi:hypothetical protein
VDFKNPFTSYCRVSLPVDINTISIRVVVVGMFSDRGRVCMFFIDGKDQDHQCKYGGQIFGIRSEDGVQPSLDPGEPACSLK